jgi:hypothetical protein
VPKTGKTTRSKKTSVATRQKVTATKPGARRTARATSSSRSHGIEEREKLWGYPDPMPIVLKALKSKTRQAEFLNLVDSPEELEAWLEENKDALPASVAELIRKYFDVNEYRYFDEVEIASNHSSLGMGCHLQLMGRRRGKVISWRVLMDGSRNGDLPDTQEMLDHLTLREVLGSGVDYDWDSESDSILELLGDDPTDESMRAAAMNYARQVETLDAEAVAEAILEAMRSKLGREEE